MIGYLRLLIGATLALVVGLCAGFAAYIIASPAQPLANPVARDRAQILGLAVALIVAGLSGYLLHLTRRARPKGLGRLVVECFLGLLSLCGAVLSLASALAEGGGPGRILGFLGALAGLGVSSFAFYEAVHEYRQYRRMSATAQDESLQQSAVTK